MKKLILSLVVVAFAVAAQAGDSKTCTAKDKTACTTKTSTSGCCSTAQATACCKGAAARQTYMSPKGAEQAPKLIASR